MNERRAARRPPPLEIPMNTDEMTASANAVRRRMAAATEDERRELVRQILAAKK